jgi:hypothetical protein
VEPVEALQTPASHFPEQQLAFSLQSEAPSLHGAHTPPAHTPLQHCDPLWQLPAAAVQTQVPPVHSPLQQGIPVQLSPPSAQVAAGEPPVAAVPELALVLVPAAPLPPLPTTVVLPQPTTALPQMSARRVTGPTLRSQGVR